MDSGRVLPVETSEERKDSCQIGMQTLAQRSAHPFLLGFHLINKAHVSLLSQPLL